MEEELKNFRLFQDPANQGFGLDFGMGNARPYGGSSYVADDMLIW
jgi:hypothetical protein